MRYLIIFFSVFTLFVSCKREVKPTFERIENVYFTRNAGILTIFADLVMHNPNPVSVTFSGADLELYLNNKHLGEVDVNKTFKADAKKDFAIPLELTFKPDRILEGLFSIGGLGRMFQTKKADFIVEGDVKVQVVKKEFEIPINSTTEIDLRMQRNR